MKNNARTTKSVSIKIGVRKINLIPTNNKIIKCIKNGAYKRFCI